MPQTSAGFAQSREVCNTASNPVRVAAYLIDDEASRCREWRGNVTEDNRIVILRGLVANRWRIRAARRREAILSNIAYPGSQLEEESLNGNDVRRIDPAVTIHITCSPPASWWDKCDIEEMPLSGDHIRGVDARVGFRPRTSS